MSSKSLPFSRIYKPRRAKLESLFAEKLGCWPEENTLMALQGVGLLTILQCKADWSSSPRASDKAQRQDTDTLRIGTVQLGPYSKLCIADLTWISIADVHAEEVV